VDLEVSRSGGVRYAVAMPKRKFRWSELLSFLFELSNASDNVGEITF